MNEVNPNPDGHEFVQAPPVLESTICPHCAALVPVGSTRCWLCQNAMEANPYRAVASEPASASAPKSKIADALLASLTIGCVVLTTIVAIGLASGAPGLIVILLFAAVPAFAIALPSLFWKASRGQMHATDVVQAAVLSVALTIGILGTIAVAAMVLLFFACLRVLSPS